MTVSAAPLQKEIYSHNPMMKGMTNYFPCIGTHCLNRGEASGRKEEAKSGRKKKKTGECLCVHMRTYHSASNNNLSLLTNYLTQSF